MEWRQFVMNLDAHAPDCIEEVLHRHGAQAVTLTDASDDPVLEPAPGSTPLWRDTRITALFSADTDFAKIRTALGVALAVEELPENHVETLADRVWEREWLRDYGPMQFGQRLWVAPDDGAPLPEDAVIVRLDPGLAFGTGTHATTALCLQWLERLDVAGRTLLDVGCGSGILGIAALKLGAESVQGIDIDPQALQASLQNAQRNDVVERLSVSDRLLPDNPPRHIVVANILAGTLIDMAAQLGECVMPGGKLGLSGILSDQADAVTAAFSPMFDFGAPACLDGWVLLSGTRT